MRRADRRSETLRGMRDRKGYRTENHRPPERPVHGKRKRVPDKPARRQLPDDDSAAVCAVYQNRAGDPPAGTAVPGGDGGSGCGGVQPAGHQEFCGAGARSRQLRRCEQPCGARSTRGVRKTRPAGTSDSLQDYGELSAVLRAYRYKGASGDTGQHRPDRS